MSNEPTCNLVVWQALLKVREDWPYPERWITHAYYSSSKIAWAKLNESLDNDPTILEIKIKRCEVKE